jgi:hypothetical protein
MSGNPTNQDLAGIACQNNAFENLEERDLLVAASVVGFGFGGVNIH